MGFFDKILNRGGSRIVLDRAEFYGDMARLSKYFADEDGITRLSQRNAYALAGSLAEINFPIDCIADKVATLSYDIVNDSGAVVERPPQSVVRLMERPNVFSSLSQMMYDAAFILLADGNLLAARNRPSLLAPEKFAPDNIASVCLLYPGTYSLHENQAVAHAFAGNISEVFSRIDHTYRGRQVSYTPDAVEILGTKGSPNDALQYPSPLMAAERNINNLLVVYQARYRAYTKNGLGVIISPKGASIATDPAAVLNSSVSRDKIVADILQRYGVAGDNPQGREKLLWGVSSVAVDATKTFATISELQPFEETREDALAIAGVFNVDKDLLPAKDGTTFTNKEAAEAALYTGPVASMAKDIADFMTRLMCLDKIGLRLMPNLVNVPILQKQRLTRADSDTKIIDLHIKMRDAGLAGGVDVKNISDSILNNYRL